MEIEILVMLTVAASILLLIVGNRIYKGRKQKKMQRQPYLPETDFVSGLPLRELVPDKNNWTVKLEPSLQLLLSLKLATIALPGWEHYTGKNTMRYTDRSSGQKLQVTSSFLTNVLQEIKDNSSVLVLYDNAKFDCIKRSLDRFTYPMAALQDGDWVLPQPIKKIFTGLYHILKGIEQTNNPLSGHFFSIAITDLIQSIELNQLLTLEEMHTLLQDYKEKTAA